jgi:hypothetical protein
MRGAKVMSGDLHPDLMRIEKERRRSCAVFACSLRCADAIRQFIADHSDLRLHLALLEGGTEESPRRKAEPTLGALTLGPGLRRWSGVPGNVRSFCPSSGIDPAFLLSTARVVWFHDLSEPIPPKTATAAWACAVNAALAARFGLPVSVYDATGRPVAMPLTGRLADAMNNDLFQWEKRRRAFTDQVCGEGLRFDPDICEPALWSRRGGAIDVGALSLPQELIWRIRRLEMWFDEGEPGQAVDEALWNAIAAEGRACVADLKATLGAHVKIDMKLLSS